jgi:hypothetical protein
VCIVEQPLGIVEPDQQSGVRPTAPGAREALAGGDGAGTIG